MNFTKMHGLGNDYVYVNCFVEQVDDPAQVAIKVSSRHTGIGGDGLILVCPSETADAQMRMFNADGSEAQMCGNGVRCVAKYVYDHNVAKAGGEFSVPGQASFEKSLRIETGRGVLTLGLQIGSNDKVQRVCVNMGEPILAGREIPIAMDGEKIIDQPVTIDGEELLMTCVSMGNPHAVFFCDDVQAIELEKIGPLIENHQMFPERINANFVQVVSSGEFIMRTWERGSGITMACGTGACSCVVAGVLTGKCLRSTIAHLPGGDLKLSWSTEDNSIYMTGPATEVFTGHWPD